MKVKELMRRPSVLRDLMVTKKVTVSSLAEMLGGDINQVSKDKAGLVYLLTWKGTNRTLLKKALEVLGASEEQTKKALQDVESWSKTRAAYETALKEELNKVELKHQEIMDSAIQLIYETELLESEPEEKEVPKVRASVAEEVDEELRSWFKGSDLDQDPFL